MTKIEWHCSGCDEKDKRIKRLEEALKPFADHADGRRSKDAKGYVCFSQIALLNARSAMEEKP